jgi:hypothetical protein
MRENAYASVQLDKLGAEGGASPAPTRDHHAFDCGGEKLWLGFAEGADVDFA